MIDDKQVRAARALLNWTQETLSEVSGVARATIKNVESGETMPRMETVNVIKEAFESAGIEFLPASGVRMKDRMVHVIEGENANQKLLDEVYNTLKNEGGEVLVAHLDERLAEQALSEDFLEKHIKRLKDAGVTERLLIKEGDDYLVAPWHYYRSVPEEYFVDTPMYIFGDKIALVSWEPIPRVIIINDKRFSDGSRKMFNFIWDRAKVAENNGGRTPS